MEYNESLKRSCQHCGAEPSEDCRNTQGYAVLPHRWRTDPYTVQLEPLKGLTLRQTLVLDVARKQIDLNGHTTAKEVAKDYPKPNQYTNIVNAMSKAAELGYLAIGVTVNRSRTFTQGVK